MWAGSGWFCSGPGLPSHPLRPSESWSSPSFGPSQSTPEPSFVLYQITHKITLHCQHGPRPSRVRARRRRRTDESTFYAILPAHPLHLTEPLGLLSLDDLLQFWQASVAFRLHGPQAHPPFPLSLSQQLRINTYASCHTSTLPRLSILHQRFATSFTNKDLNRRLKA